MLRFGDAAHWPAGAAASTMDWENHQSIRLRLLLASVGEMVQALEKAIQPTSGTPNDYYRFFTATQGPRSYPFSGLGKLAVDPATGLHTSQAGLGKWLLDTLMDIRSVISRTIAANPPPAPSPDPADDAPKPTPELRLRHRI